MLYVISYLKGLAEKKMLNRTVVSSKHSIVSVFVMNSVF